MIECMLEVNSLIKAILMLLVIEFIFKVRIRSLIKGILICCVVKDILFGIYVMLLIVTYLYLHSCSL